MMTFPARFILFLGTGVLSARAYLQDPPTKASADTVSDCSYWEVAESGKTCNTIASQYAITVNDFSNVYNPSVGPSCKLVIGQSYCVERNYGITPTSTTSTSKSTTSTTTATGNGITTPTPTQNGMVSNCNKFYYVKKDDSCDSVAAAYGISTNDFITWNKGVGPDCKYLWSDTYFCVGIIGGTTSSKLTAPTTTTSVMPPTTTGNGVTTPSPTQSGMVSNCNRFHKVGANDTCFDIAKKYSIEINDFYKWNSGIGSNCERLWLNTNYCVGLIGQTLAPTMTTSRPTSTTTSNGITTPTPTQSGMTKNCDRFHYVEKDQQCGDIASRYGISLSQFYSWNTGVGDKCQYLNAYTYCCVRAFK